LSQRDQRELKAAYVAGMKKWMISGANFTENSEPAFFAALASLHSQKPLMQLRVQLQ